MDIESKSVMRRVAAQSPVLMAEKYASVKRERDDLATVLRRYMAAYPAFRMKPLGAPGSSARIEQENLMALEESAQAILAKLQAPSDKG